MEWTIYQANRREVEFDVTHAAFSAAFEALLGRTDVGAFADAAALTAEAARDRLASFVGPLDFSLFQKIDHGGLRTAIAGKPTLATTYVFGNALIAVQMTTYDARAGLYVPLRLFVQEIARSRVTVTYDLPSATMTQFGVPEIDDVARSLDAKVQRLRDSRPRILHPQGTAVTMTDVYAPNDLLLAEPEAPKEES
jgi:hypothetical protein